MDDMGNILIKRLAKSQIYVKNTMEENALSNDIIKLQNGLLEFEKPFKLFDMKKFQQNVNRELKRQYPDRRKLESQCISLVSFGTSSSEIWTEQYTSARRWASVTPWPGDTPAKSA